MVRCKQLAFAAGAVTTAALGCTACSSCRRDTSQQASRHEPSFEVAPGRLTAPWSWEESKVADIGVPAPCRSLGAPRRFRAPTTDLFFLAVPGNVTGLAVATGRAKDGELTATRGLVMLQPQPASAPVRDLPWLHVLSPPVLASDAGRWLALLRESDPLQGQHRVWLWRENTEPQLLGSGEGFGAVDARCEGGACVLLTTRHTRVAAPGATVWFGAMDASVDQFTPQDLWVDGPEDPTTPVAIAGWNAQQGRVTVALQTTQDLVFVEATRSASKRLAVVPQERVLLDVVRTRDAAVAVFARGEANDAGCVPGGGRVVIAVQGREPSVHYSPSLPTSGYAQPLRSGAFLTWISEVNCMVPERKVVNGLVLRPDGSPASAPMGIGNADGHAVSTQGDEVHIWLRDAQGVTWVRAQCDASAGLTGGTPLDSGL